MTKKLRMRVMTMGVTKSRRAMRKTKPMIRATTTAPITGCYNYIVKMKDMLRGPIRTGQEVMI